jgi:hypothetical protein
MSIAKQRLILIALFLGVTFAYTQYLWLSPSFSCETLQNSHVFSLDFGAMNALERRDIFVSWAKVYADEGTFSDRVERVEWEKDRIIYEAYFQETQLEHIKVTTHIFRTDVSDIKDCFGSPSATHTISVSNADNGNLNLNYLLYDDLRMIVTGTAPTTAEEGTISPLDEDAEVRYMIIYSPDAYEREKH